MTGLGLDPSIKVNFMVPAPHDTQRLPFNSAAFDSASEGCFNWPWTTEASLLQKIVVFLEKTSSKLSINMPWVRNLTCFVFLFGCFLLGGWGVNFWGFTQWFNEHLRNKDICIWGLLKGLKKCLGLDYFIMNHVLGFTSETASLRDFWWIPGYQTDRFFIIIVKDHGFFFPMKMWAFGRLKFILK